ncbi:MAG TPA: hypothetical protein VEY33_07990, partial [Gemmatimonadota bacterium]|nr:hypothetical protein [Gemmatimonadota bacterium]
CQFQRGIAACEAEGKGFEPSVDRKAHSGFQDAPAVCSTSLTRAILHPDFAAVGPAVGQPASRAPAGESGLA